MAPASKRLSHTEEMVKTESAPQNSITVAAGTAAAPASSDSGDVHAAGGSPTKPSKKSTEAVVEEVTPAAVPSNNNRDASEQNGHAMPRVQGEGRSAGRNYYDDYEFSDLDEITVRQLNEDICAYKYDLEYCKAQLEEADLNPQETRTLQLRTLDLGHQMRHCKHRIETIKVQTRKRTLHPTYRTALAMSYAGTSSVGSSSQQQPRAGGAGAGPLLPGGRAANTPALANGKRPAGMFDEDGGSAKRMKLASPEMDSLGGGGGGEGGADDGINTVLQRLGFWKCRLCSAPKYLLAGAGRTPAAPCKWPLKDISKMITHFTEMHTEHTPTERCVELGAALAQNRGPFEYWLRRTRAQNISDSSVIENCVSTLLHGDMPDLLRRHSRAAAGMPFS